RFQAPTRSFHYAAEADGRRDVVVRRHASMARGERRSADRVEYGEAALRAGDPGQLSQPGYRIQQVRDQAGREDRVKAVVADRQALGVAEHEATDTLPTKTLRFEQHL